MSMTKTKKLRLCPAPGPLCWLHPELIALDGIRLNRDATKDEHLVDLGVTGWTGAQLLARIRENAHEQIEISDGPRGHALWGFLKQALRDQDIDLKRPALHPLSGGDGVEARILEATRKTGSCDTVVFNYKRPDHIHIETVPLTASAKRSLRGDGEDGQKRTWVLPLKPGPDLARDLDRAVEVVSTDPHSFGRARLIPVFITDPPETALHVEDQTAPVETRLMPSWWGVLPGDGWPRDLRIRFHELIRLLHPDRYFQFAAFESHALTGVDLYLEGLMRRLGEEPGAPSIKRTKPIIIGICGTDGSGKSSHVTALKEYLTGKGLSVEVHKIYRHGVFHETVTDLTRQCAGGRNLHLWRLQRIVKVFDSIKYLFSSLRKPLSELDVVIFDRYVFTHFAAGVGRYHHDPFAREMLTVFPEADRVFLLDVPTDEALRRIGTREEKTVDENQYMLSRYRHTLCDLSDRFGFVKLDATDPIEHNKSAILDEVTRLLEEKGLLGGGA